MATNYIFNYVGGSGQLIGSYVNIGYGSVMKYIELILSHQTNTLGRLVTVAYWICDRNFDITNLEMDPTKENGPRYCTSINTSKATTMDIRYAGDDFNTLYVNTNSISNNQNDICRFNFNQDSKGIKASKIFVALLSTKENSGTYDYKNATLAICMDYGSTYIKDNINSNNVRVDNNGGLYIYGSLFENPDGSNSNSEQSSNVKPAKIQCSDLRYRTWSDPNGTFLVDNDSFESKYTIAFADGGNNYSDVSDFSTLNYTYRNSKGTIKTHIVNKDESFETDFCIPEGRLSDVVFAYPEREAYDFEVSSETGASEGRWVFKRSRIKFTIPPAKNNGKVVNKGIILRYKIITSIYDKNAYSGKYKIKTYSANAASKNIELVICPRDEGILDNMEFTVLLSRKYVGASNNQYSTEAAYKFHTYQKPTVNIASPKIIRNSSTGEDFKYAKILTSNMYSNFNGENTIVNKYVCDALTVMLATSQNDASDIPMFVRFFLAEYKYGRDGRITNRKASSLDTAYDKNFDTVQDLYKSKDESKYTSKEEILTNNVGKYKRTAHLTGIYSNDGQPILLSGRFTKSTIAEVGETYKLWTYKDWDYVTENKNNDYGYDELVGNAWIVESVEHDSAGNIRYDADKNPIKKVLTPCVVGDHMGAPVKTYWSDGTVKTAKQKVSKNILFRAGYIYLLRARMFHGAAAGAIAKKIDTSPNTSIKKKYNIIYGNENSGEYDYTDAIYSTGKVYPNVDIITHGQLKPYDGWQGPEDGTSGEPLYKDAITYNNRLEQTYGGFSEVDYTLIEPVCPYTSKSNLITVHPTSPQISANQWITFNYRHLAKNVAGIDTNAVYYDNASKTYKTESQVFGKTAAGIQNTLTRITSMYTSAVETILDNYNTKISRTADGFDKLMGNLHKCKEEGVSPKLVSEKISLWIKPIAHRTLDNSEDKRQDFISAYNKHDSNNYPLIFDYLANGKSIDTIKQDNELYHKETLCRQFKDYRTKLKSVSDKSTCTFDLSGFNRVAAPEFDITYRVYNRTETGSTTRYLGLKEPLGNTYRWQPVINAISVTGSKVNEIQIENKNNDTAKGYMSGDNTLRQDRAFNAANVKLIYADDDKSPDYDLQTKYFYVDKYTLTPKNTSIESIFTNNATHRFSIHEFCGLVSKGGSIYNPGYAVMYTTPNNDVNRVGYKYGTNTKSLKYFCTAELLTEYPGHLYTRVPSVQDCECGIPTPSGLANIGNISSKGAISINSNEDNTIPITRTTHYLYFKTWINTTFCMKVDVELEVNDNCTYETVTDEEGNSEEIHKEHETKIVNKTFWFNGTKLVSDDDASLNPQIKGMLSTYPASEIKLGNFNGLSEVYGEDNNGWGRCLSADDISNRQIKFDGSINSKKTNSGGLEVPIMVRYTPLLQPVLLAKTCTDINDDKKPNKYLSLSSLNITLYKNRGQKKWTSGFVDGSLTDGGTFKQIKTNQIDLKVAYPYINEMNTYNTVSPNGGNSGNVYFENYYIDVDTDASKSIDSITDTEASTNMDFLGGNGICTAYTALLVPSNPELPSKNSDKYNWYFNNTDKHWNFYKQPANYYKFGNIFAEKKDGGVRSKTIANCGPVLVGYNLQPQYKDSCNYLDNEFFIKRKCSIPDDFIDVEYRDSKFKGRNFQTISLNFTALRQGHVALYNNDNVVTQSKANELLGFNLSSDNILQPGVIYDLVIIPVYSNRTITNLNYKKSDSLTDYEPGKINNETPGGDNNEGEVHFAGSNPLVLYNYLQIGLETEISPGGGGIGGGETPPRDDDEPDPTKIWDSDSAIIFPNVDNKTFNVTSGKIQEPPGFWLNNSFKLILRMPSFRLKGKEYSHSDTNTIDNISNGLVLTNDGKTADNVEFSDIQIHIGKISELEKYGYPDNQHLNLDKISDKNELAKAHIISYNNYGHMGMGVFSKKLSNYNISKDENGNDVDEDTRELLTGGSLDPYSDAYAHRFIEVNLSNCKIANEKGDLVPIYTAYPEGFYIQFRWKTKYSESQPEEQRWSSWYGGSYDGGLHWWGDKGVDYFVPIRNYSNIYTDFRNHVKESYPGAYNTMPIEPIKIDEDIKSRISEAIIGKGSIMTHGSVNENSKNNPKDSANPAFYHIGVGNHIDSLIVPANNKLNIAETLKDKDIILNNNNDSVYISGYKNSHDNNKNIDTGNPFNNHQNLWEMLYVDYIIRNMCKLYYKAEYNKRINDDVHKFIPKNSKYENNLYYHSATPKGIVLNYKTWGWDDTEFRIFNDSSLIKAYKGPGKEKEFSEIKSYENNKLYEYDAQTDSVNSKGIRQQGPVDTNVVIHDKIKTFSKAERERWNRNKYYRRIITRQDFDELNNHLEELVDFIRHPYFTGLNTDNFDMVGDAVPVSKKELALTFSKSRAGIIGHDTSRNSGLSTAHANINNINHTMMDSNYIQHIWQNILSVCRPSIQISIKNNITLK